MDNKSFSRFSWYKPEEMGKFDIPVHNDREWIKDTFDHAVLDLFLAATGLTHVELSTILQVDYPQVDNAFVAPTVSVVYTAMSACSTFGFGKPDSVMVGVVVSKDQQNTTIRVTAISKPFELIDESFVYDRQSEFCQEELERIKNMLIDKKISSYFAPHIDNAMLTAWLISTPVKDIVVLDTQTHAAKFRKNLVLLFDDKQNSSSEDKIDRSCMHLTLFHIKQRVKLRLILSPDTDSSIAHISVDDYCSTKLHLNQDLVAFIKGVIPKDADSSMDLGDAIRTTATCDQEIQDYFNTILTQDTTVVMDIVGGYHVVDTKNNLNFRLDMLPIRRYPLAEAFGVYAGGTCLGQYRDTSKLLDKLSYRRTDHVKTVEQIQSDMVMGYNTNTPNEDGKPCFIDYKQMGSVNLGPCER